MRMIIQYCILMENHDKFISVQERDVAGTPALAGEVGHYYHLSHQ